MEKVRIGDFIDVLTDYHSNGSYESLRDNVTLLREKNYAVMIRTLNFEQNDFKDDLIYVDEKAYHYLSKSKVYPNDILTNKIANPGSIYIMPDLQCPATCGMNLFLIRFSSDVNQRYMYYCMKNSEVYIKSFAHGTTTKTITKDEIRNIDLLIHKAKSDQDIIAKLLTSIDNKILSNSKISDKLEQMASTVFMHYFFKRTPNGKLGSVIIEHQKSNIQVGEAEDANGNVPFFTSGDSVLKCNNALVDDRCCYLNTGGNVDVKFYVGKAAYSTDTWCISGKDQLSDYLFLLLNAIKPELDIKFFQGTGLKHLQKPLLKDRSIYIPTTDELSAFNAQIMPMMTKISENTRENQQLIQLRDWLLPMLMNGQATVAD